MALWTVLSIVIPALLQQSLGEDPTCQPVDEIIVSACKNHFYCPTGQCIKFYFAGSSPGLLLQRDHNVVYQKCILEDIGVCERLKNTKLFPGLKDFKSVECGPCSAKASNISLSNSMLLATALATLNMYLTRI